MMQANNQILGSPSSRINLTAKWASIGYTRSLTNSRSLHNVGLTMWLRDRWDAFVFRFTLSIVNIAFWLTTLKQSEHRFFAGMCDNSHLTSCLQNLSQEKKEAGKIEYRRSSRQWQRKSLE